MEESWDNDITTSTSTDTNNNVQAAPVYKIFFKINFLN